MRERINRLAKGMVDTQIPEPIVTPDQIDETVQAGEISRFELDVADAGGVHLKGLVYSSNIRVRILNSAFGGTRNRIRYEVDGAHLTQEDVIEGALYFVTNGGERKIPYRFQLEGGNTARTLESLKKPEDFGAIAMADWEKALRLFEYADFVDAPFMQEVHIRTLYDGLKGHANRQNLLEEFLVALRLKEPVEISRQKEFYSYDNLEAPLQGFLEVEKNVWGHVEFQVSADGDFLELPQKLFTSQDFQDRICRIPYVLNPSRLHHGKNMGALTIAAVRTQMTVRFEVQGDEKNLRQGASTGQVEFGRYLANRLEYELGIYEDRLLLNQMQQALDRMRRGEEDVLLTTLLQVELSVMQGSRERAGAMLDACKEAMQEQRQKKQILYCYYQYLQFLIQKKDGQRDGLIRMFHKYLEEKKGAYYLFFLWMKLEPSMGENPAQLLERMRELFQDGCSSPFLYVQSFLLIQKDHSLLKRMDSFELQVIHYAAKKELIDQELALQIARMAGGAKHYRKLYVRVLKRLYDKYPEKELLAAVCAMLIKGDCRESVYFPWYQKALEQGISLTRLYEYYLYALPKDYPYLLPKEVLLYFSYEKDLGEKSRSTLYMNILRYLKPEASLYKQYERDMEQFAMEALLKSRINRKLVVLYQHMIYPEMVDQQVARVLPAILRSYRVRIKNPNMKYIVVCYEELNGEDAFPIQDGVAYVPLFLEHTVFLFQDGYGNRYANIPYRKYPAMEKTNVKELEETCFDLYPDHPMLRLKECGELVAAGISCEADVATLWRAGQDLSLKPLYQKRVLSRVIEYYQKHLSSEGGVKEVDFLMNLDFGQLNQKERASVCETLIHGEYYLEAFDLIREYGWQGVPASRLLQLCTHTILNHLFHQDEVLLNLSYRVFSQGNYDSVVLDYLCEHFNGTSKHMFRILSKAVSQHVETFDMAERLLAQMIFSGETTHMDQVFDWYLSGKRTGDNLVKAYFTLKAVDFYLKDQVVDRRVFAWLEGTLHYESDMRKMPTIYLMALTKYYAGLHSLDEEQKKLCQSMTEYLLSEGRVFAHLKALGRLIPMPDSVMDRVTIEYKGKHDVCPKIQIRILPEEEAFHEEEMRRIYPGIFIRQKILFEGETLEYCIYEGKGETRTLAQEGTISWNREDGKAKDSRYAALNAMGICLSMKKESELKENMKKYVTDSAVMEELFFLL